MTVPSTPSPSTPASSTPASSTPFPSTPYTDASAASTEPAPPVWRWLVADPAGVARPEPVITFGSQKAAEDWLGEEFQNLADDGVSAVTLMDGERAVYGPMLLTPDGDGPIAEAQF